MTATEKQSAEMVAGYQADPKSYFKAHAINNFLPPLAPAIMERLGRGFGSMDEQDYYARTEQFDADMTEHHEMEMKAAKGKQTPVRSLKKFGDTDEDDLPF